MLYIYGILLFSGRDPVSELIKTVTASQYSHCALALRDDKTLKEYVFESTGSFHQLVWQHVRPQVQLNSLSGTIDAYDGKVVVRTIRNIRYRDVSDYIKPLIGIPYERSIGELIEALERGNKTENDTSMFCSELVAKTLIDNGYLLPGRLPNNYMPKDFSAAENNCPGLLLRPEKVLRGDDSCCCICL
jgi:hypothetical protein